MEHKKITQNKLAIAINMQSVHSKTTGRISGVPEKNYNPKRFIVKTDLNVICNIDVKKRSRKKR